MTIVGPSDDRPSKNRRRDAQQKAKQLRDEQKKKDRRNRVFLRSGIIVGSLAIVALIAVVIVTSIRPVGPGPANMASDGLLIGEGMKVVTTSALSPEAKPVPTEPDTTGTVTDIRVYVDYLCQLCGQFDKTNGEQIAKWVGAGAATVEIHPIALLTHKSAGTEYSLRAANAAACVADSSPDDFFAFNSAMFTDQPEEGSAGRSDDDLLALVEKSGVHANLASIRRCIDDRTFVSWVKAATDRAVTGPVPNSDLTAIKGTPTVLVNGKQYVGSLNDPKEFAAFVLQAAGETYSTSTATPTPTPTPTPAG
ncbi:DsbA family protein [Glaciibacter psychrotolerans]|uniref:Protein-disulfide isomerase n=1 Tax=Glaciibacter psychrotolerans TaxID=670054 RepID=A0A7Z0EAV2_9MICO|nr:thioredoxin domain-containing protein [Leifsonia psychrotolerans]NYJ18236.1 protein-disulfide isomerase [Leifsonia psychrotolerans]